MRLCVALIVLSVAGCVHPAFIPDLAKDLQADTARKQETRLPVRLAHQALVDGQWRQSDDETWRARGEREAVLDYAARLFGCRVATLKAEKPHGLWMIDGCAQGVFVSVSQWVQPTPTEPQILATEFFVDVATEPAAAAYDAMLPAVPAGDGTWYVQGAGGDVVHNLERLAAINDAGARALACPRSRVAHDVVSLRGGRMTIVEGCERRATFLDDEPRVWRLLSIVDLRREHAAAQAGP
jgi:hypothetical protein